MPIETKELEAVQLESTHTIEIDSFVPKDEIDERYIEKPYYIVPNDANGEEAFAVIRDAMRDKDKVAIARIVMANRERILAIKPLGKGLARHDAALSVRDARGGHVFPRHQGEEDAEGHGVARGAHPRKQERALRSARNSRTATRTRSNR